MYRATDSRTRSREASPQSEQAAATPQLSASEQFAAGIGNQAMATLARGYGDYEAAPDLSQGAPDYDRERLDILGQEPGIEAARNPGITPTGEGEAFPASDAIQGDAISSVHESLELDDPRALGEEEPLTLPAPTDAAEGSWES